VSTVATHRIKIPSGLPDLVKVSVRKCVLWIGLGLVLLLVVVIAVVILPRSLAQCPAVPGAPSSTAASSDPTGADGIGDVYFPRSGNSGYHVTSYDIQFHYEPATDRLHGQTTITARATENLARFKLDLRLPADAVAVDDRPATIQQEAGKLQVTPAVAVRAGAPMTVRVDYAGVPSAIPSRHCGASPWLSEPGCTPLMVPSWWVSLTAPRGGIPATTTPSIRRPSPSLPSCPLICK
jgi:hypothetical protein